MIEEGIVLREGEADNGQTVHCRKKGDYIGGGRREVTQNTG